jgi:choline dehydrogenase-like flavoprotein
VKKRLECFQIDVINDLPAVGQNLASPMGGGLMFKVNDSSAVTEAEFSTLVDLGKLAVQAFKYATIGKGHFSTTGIDLIAHLQTEGVASTTKGTPDYQVLILPSDTSGQLVLANVKQEVLLCRIYGHSHYARFKVMKSMTANLNGGFAFSAMITALHPESRGSVVLKSSSPNDRPIIDPRLLSSDKDVKTLVKGYLS